MGQEFRRTLRRLRTLELALLIAVCVVWCGCKTKTKANATSAGPATVIYLVRHAEKAKDGSKNPPLTPVGFKRALALARMLHSTPLHAVYATEYKRTQQTAAPAANAKRLPVKVLGAGKGKELYRLITTRHVGQTVLVSGHSNTVPALIKALGGPATLRLVEKTDYDNVFVVIWRKGGASTYLRLHVGPPPPR